MNTKICKGCNLDLSLSKFNKHTSTKDGLRTKCIECRRIEHIEYRDKNPEKIKELQKLCDKRKVSTLEGREKKRARNRKYAQTPEGKLKISISYNRNYSKYKLKRVYNYRLQTPEEKIKRTKAIRLWRENNRDKANALDSLRRSRKLNATPSWLTNEDKLEIIELFTICQMFRLYTGQEYHVDHIVPLSNKNVCGLHVPWNLQVISAFDNMSKNNKFNESLGINYSANAYKVYAT
jgi:hypothetical protein